MNFKSIKHVIFALLLTMPAVASAQALWQEGTHYNVISEKASDDKRIREVFSFWCPACYSFEAIVIELKTKLPSDVAFTKAHVNFMGSTTPEIQSDATKAMIAAKAMKKEAEFNAALFDAIHKQRKNITGMDDILAVYAATGGDSATLGKMAKSFGVRSLVAKNNKLTRGVSSVPTFIVNDKYQAVFGRNMTPDQFIDLLLWLTTQK